MLLEEIIDIHFDPHFGARYWLEVEKRLGINVRREVTTPDDLALLGPMDAKAMRKRPVSHFIPARLHSQLAQMIFSETGGTTGSPAKRVFLPEEFEQAFVAPWQRAADARKFPARGSWLFVGPGGPHIIAQAARAFARAGGSLEPFSVDCDVRWFKKQAQGSLGHAVYMDHVVSQALDIIHCEEIEILFITPPLLIALHAAMSDDEIRRIKGIHLGGVYMDAALYRKIRLELFPGAVVLPGYGNSLLGVAFESSGPDKDGNPCFVVDDSSLIYSAIQYDEHGVNFDPETAMNTTVPEGSRGRLVASRLDRSFLIANLVERDTAVLRSTAEDDGSSRLVLHDVRPLASARQQSGRGVY